MAPLTSSQLQHQLRYRALVTDIEGTTTDILFVHNVMFPYAHDHIEQFVQQHLASPTDKVCQVLEQLKEQSDQDAQAEQSDDDFVPMQSVDDLQSIIAYVKWQMKHDRKTTSLKLLQGLMWADAFASGEIVGEVYDDVVPVLRELHAAGIPLYVYSSGSVAAQKLLFGHSKHGDLTTLFSGNFDTTTGSKLEAGSYTRIAADIKQAPADVMFVSDNVKELLAAKEAGMQTALSLRENNAPVTDDDRQMYHAIASFSELLEREPFVNAASSDARTVAKGVARIKPQFLVSNAKPAEVSIAEQSERVEDAAEDSEERPAKRAKTEKRATGQNKPSERPRDHVVETVQLCNMAARGEPCTRPDCRFTHDIATYMAERGPDIGDECPNYMALGSCPYAARCLFSKHHTDPAPSYAQRVDASKANDSTYLATVTTVNGISRELQNQLRKKSVKFHKADEYTRLLSKVQQTEQARAAEVDGDAVALQDNSARPVQAALAITPREKKRLEFRGKSYLAPLTTVGNLPFRRLCKQLGVDITCGEMANVWSLLNGAHTEWALMKRHPSEDFFGVQIAGNKPHDIAKACELMMSAGPDGGPLSVDFVDLNMGCPVDFVYKHGGGSALLERHNHIGKIVRGMDYVLECPVTVKMRTGVKNGKNTTHNLVPQLAEWNVALATLHGRSREQRYKALADWDYINQCAELKGDRMALFGNGDILSYAEYHDYLQNSAVDGIMIGRGALIKPWIFTEIKEQRHWDISSRERLDLLRDFTRFGLEHWGSDMQGVNTTRRFLLEQISFTHRYIPVGLLEVLPQKMNERPPKFHGRDELETLMASSEMLLGPAPATFKFEPKHKANSYED
ncbi:tRNA-dihydrouridine synthase 3 [Sorochytrium milnesiophthora]